MWFPTFFFSLCENISILNHVNYISHWDINKILTIFPTYTSNSRAHKSMYFCVCFHFISSNSGINENRVVDVKSLLRLVEITVILCNLFVWRGKEPIPGPGLGMRLGCCQMEQVAIFCILILKKTANF